MAQIDPRKFIKGETKSLTFPSGSDYPQDANNDPAQLDFGAEYAFYKVTCANGQGLPASPIIYLTINYIDVYVNNIQILLEPANNVFVWYISLMGGANYISFYLSAVTSLDVTFQITPYEQAQTE